MAMNTIIATGVSDLEWLPKSTLQGPKLNLIYGKRVTESSQINIFYFWKGIIFFWTKPDFMHLDTIF